MVVDKNTAISDIEDTFKRFIKRDDIDIILINQNIAEMIRHVIDSHTQPIPSVLEIPSKDHPYDASKDSILRRAKAKFNPLCGMLAWSKTIDGNSNEQSVDLQSELKTGELVKNDTKKGQMPSHPELEIPGHSDGINKIETMVTNNDRTIDASDSKQKVLIDSINSLPKLLKPNPIGDRKHNNIHIGNDNGMNQEKINEIDQHEEHAQNKYNKNMINSKEPKNQNDDEHEEPQGTHNELQTGLKKQQNSNAVDIDDQAPETVKDINDNTKTNVMPQDTNNEPQTGLKKQQNSNGIDTDDQASETAKDINDDTKTNVMPQDGNNEPQTGLKKQQNSNGIDTDDQASETAKDINDDIKTNLMPQVNQDQYNSLNREEWNHSNDEKLLEDQNDLIEPDQHIDQGDQTQNIPKPSDQKDIISHYHSLRTDEESHFFTYFTIVSLISIVAYIGYYNKQKILAIVLEGRRSRNSRGRRRPSTANYRKLDCTLEEAVTSQCNANVTHVIY
ncbi:V-type proton ATPase subunit Vha14-1 isoform X2 [Nomia melanderi]|nr:trans-Golgi network integral membrane protein 1 isoform X3 [Nomia melanderi]